MAPANPSGSKTVARHHGRVGNSGDPLDSSKEGGRVAQPAHWQEAPTVQRKSDVPIRATKRGNAR